MAGKPGAGGRKAKRPPKVGSGGQRRRGLEGRGPTPKASDREYHQAYKTKQRAQALAGMRPGGRSGSVPRRRSAGADDWIIGRNAVLEALKAGVPVTAAYVAEGAERDARLNDIFQFTADHGIPLSQITRRELDRLVDGAVHQSIALRIPAYDYAEFDDLVDQLIDTTGLLVVCEGITDPQNLGAIIRSAAGFGAVGVVIPSRRSAQISAVVWKTSAGQLARVPVAKVTNINRCLEALDRADAHIVGLAGESDLLLPELTGLGEVPVVVVVGSEGQGLSPLVRKHCHDLVRIPMAADVESLNASVATGICLYHIQTAGRA